MNDDLFSAAEALTFDDLLIEPGYSQTLPSQMDVRARLAGDIWLNIPILSAAMDTVTEARMAIALAREGGIGIIHRNLSPEAQAKEVEIVKRSESGMISDPITLTQDATLQDAEAIMASFHISGIPIVMKDSQKLVGIITNRDIRFAESKDVTRPVSDFMTREGLVTAPLGTTLEQAKSILQEHRIEKLPLVDDKGNLQGLITVKDIQKSIQYPNASKDSQGRLLVGAAVGVGADLELRAELMASKGVDVLVVDTAHGHSAGVVKAIQRIKAVLPAMPVIGGNVVTAEGTQALIKAGADAVKVGVGAGSICTTRIISGAGMPQMTAIHACAVAARSAGIPIIADGGIKHSGDIVKAMTAGAETVMLGSLLAGLDEAPGDLVLYEGRQFKTYRGMGSVGALQGYGRDRYGSGQGEARKLVPEGIEGMIAYKGALSDYVYQLIGGLRSGMGYAGATCLEDLRSKTRLVRITNAGLIESHPHDVTITRDAPNYQRGN
ncbi:IMP dehydrogenase [Pelolinea submarina]|uniref:Inosine-5'-monophosphate dehydrogenase n=1 Tax=Pelolinea submarina TaxID=913107 RepID=A0A347ZQ61_9CHLR|nr:IMP dehydrogenase [Pelolinea submarina]REG06229.1 inosine-5'-monophosphate dehydrogenase [Pelolinea submarina]BBB47442.1 IMP dehydrogenase [Pelolinea submarina]